MTEVSQKEKMELDSLLNQFDSWQMAMVGLETGKTILKDKLELAQRENKELLQRCTQYKKDIADMQEMISKVQSELTHVCSLEDEIKSLKALSQSKDIQINGLNEMLVKAESEHKGLLTELENRHQNELITTKESIEAKAQIELDNLSATLAEKDQSISLLKGKLVQTESEKQGEIVRLTMEYEGKISKLQRQKNQTMTTQSSGATQEIFRKKLQFMKSESDREIGELKKTISDLQQKISSLQREPTKLSLSMAKKRRY